MRARFRQSPRFMQSHSPASNRKSGERRGKQFPPIVCLTSLPVGHTARRREAGTSTSDVPVASSQHLSDACCPERPCMAGRIEDTHRRFDRLYQAGPESVSGRGV